MSTDTRPRVETRRAAPPRPALSDAQIDQLRRALEARKAQLLRAHEDREEEATELEAEAGDVADVAEGVIEDRQRARLDDHDRALLEEITHALSKIASGTYGRSEVSGQPIPFERLVALPWTRCRAEEARRLEHAPDR